ncbi:MAG: FAD-dependent oxidoreductase [Clostridia bacterium]|nr:FAD-dependent oxidoreductase [Clostridia bacterium]
MKRFIIIFGSLLLISVIFYFAKPLARNNYKAWAATTLAASEAANKENAEKEKVEKFTVVVVGSDPEGITAAISAARSGANTVLLGEQDAPGGLFTYGMLNTIDMNRDGNGDVVTRGIFNEFYLKLGNTESFDVERAKSVFLEMIEAEPRLTYRPGYTFVAPIMDGNTIKGVTMQNLLGDKVDFMGTIIIDATQDGDVAAAAGADYTVGMEDVNLEANMAATLVFKIKGVDWALLAKDVSAYKAKTNDTNCGINRSTAWGFGKWCYNKYKPLHSNMRLRGPNLGLQDDGTVLVNALQILDVDGLNKESVKKAIEEGEVEAKNALEYLKGLLPSFENAEFVGIADELYIRETRHIKGEYVLSVTDILDNTNFYDKIALASYPIDVQTNTATSTGYVIGSPTVYSIPLRCLVPLKIDNIFVVGKSASYTSSAAGSARVVPVGMVEGESAGTAAVYCAVYNLTPRELCKNIVYMDGLTTILRNQGVYLPEFEYKSNIPNVLGLQKIKKLINLGFMSGGYNNDFRFEDVPKVSTFCVALINGLQRTEKEQYNYTNISKIKRYYSEEDDLTSMVAGKIILSLFDIDTTNLSDEETWQLIIENKCFDDMYEVIRKDQKLNKRQLYVLTVNTLERFLGREIG